MSQPLPRPLRQALEQEATVLTASAYQARAIRAAWAAEQRTAQRRSWPTPDVLPLPAWLARTWEEAVIADDAGELPQLLRPAQESAIWERVVLSTAATQEYLLPHGAARTARRSWQRLHDWAIDPQLVHRPSNEAADVFPGWTRYFSRHLAERGWLDGARALWRVPFAAHSDSAATIAFAGFDIETPALRALIARMRSSGRNAIRVSTAAGPAAGVRVGLPDSDAELRAAAQWTLQRLRAEPEARLLVIVADLEQRRASVERLFGEILQPVCSLIDAPVMLRPFAIEGGQQLSHYPIVVAALTALKLASAELPFEEASRWLRTPYLGGGAAAASLRARIDVKWRCVARPEVDLGALIHFLKASTSPGQTDEPLQGALERFAHQLRASRSGLSHWSGAFAAALRELGWPGSRPLDSAEFQTLQKFNDTLAELAMLDLIAGPVELTEAVGALTGLAQQVEFQPDTADPPLTISSRDADPCVAYDGVWIAGAHANAWPEPPRPDPLIPHALQSAAGLPNATATGTLELAKGVTARLLASAPQVIVSWPMYLDEADSVPSPLFTDLPLANLDSLIPMRTPIYRHFVRESGTLEQFADEMAPPVKTPARLRGGATSLRLQSLCPFRAFAERRLDAAQLEQPQPGIDPRTRGKFIHYVLEKVWAGLDGREALLALSTPEREALIEGSIRNARNAILERPRRWPMQIIAIECERLQSLLRAWLEEECARPPFRVAALERKIDWSLGGLTFQLRIDRFDELGDGRTLLIDYKTGEADIRRWLGDRPDEPQMPLYSIALDRPPDALTFGLLGAGTCAFDGLSSLPVVLPSLRGVEDWPQQLKSWQEVVVHLASGFERGDARVDPKDRTVCSACHLHALCRVDEVLAQRSQTDDGE